VQIETVQRDLKMVFNFFRFSTEKNRGKIAKKNRVFKVKKFSDISQHLASLMISIYQKPIIDLPKKKIFRLFLQLLLKYNIVSVLL
jgi:hypothetical protein